jgi:hypothetical protein
MATPTPHRWQNIALSASSEAHREHLIERFILEHGFHLHQPL